MGRIATNKNDYDQETNEGTYAYANRIQRLWIEDEKTTRKNCYFRTQEFFMRLFIDGLRDNKVKRRMQRWFKEQKNTNITIVINVADEFQQE